MDPHSELSPEDYDRYIESLRLSEFPQLLGTTYLDHAGTTLYPSSLIATSATDLQTHLFGNPHSASPSSHLSSSRIDHARELVLKHFDADPACFDVIFTANATAAIKLVRDAFIGADEGFAFGYHRDCHTSIVGLRESARDVSYFEGNEDVQAWIEDGARLTNLYPAYSMKNESAPPLQLFAYPAQSNLSGCRRPLSWVGDIRQANRVNSYYGSWSISSSEGRSRVYTLLDAASFLTTSRLSLADPAQAPDFICLSFYKIFGFPDLGALIVNKSTGAADFLAQTRSKVDQQGESRERRMYFGGGTVDMIINSKRREEDWFAMKTAHHQTTPDHAGDDVAAAAAAAAAAAGDVHEILEDGTLPFHSIVALEHAFGIHDRIFGGGERIRKHTTRLVKALYREFNSLRYRSGRKVVEIYRDYSSTFGDPKTQGPILAFNVLSPDGTYIGKSEVERAARAAGFQLRMGGVCNPGGIARHLKLDPWEMRRNYAEGVRCGNDIDVIGGKATGIVRASLGAMSCMRDVRRFAPWVRWWFVEGAESFENRSSAEKVYAPGVDRMRKNENVERFVAVDGLEAGKVIWRKEPNHDGRKRGYPVSEAIDDFERDWVIVSLEPGREGRALEGDVLKRVPFKVELIPEDGILRISTTLPLPQSLSGESTVDIGLWDPPPLQQQNNPATSFEDAVGWGILGKRRKADPYTNPQVRQFFSVALGVPCTLARYRSRYLVDTRTWTCVKAGCGGVFGTEEELMGHYEGHVEDFEEWLKKKEEGGNDGKEEQRVGRLFTGRPKELALSVARMATQRVQEPREEEQSVHQPFMGRPKELALSLARMATQSAQEPREEEQPFMGSPKEPAVSATPMETFMGRPKEPALSATMKATRRAQKPREEEQRVDEPFMGRPREPALSATKMTTQRGQKLREEKRREWESRRETGPSIEIREKGQKRFPGPVLKVEMRYSSSEDSEPKKSLQRTGGGARLRGCHPPMNLSSVLRQRRRDEEVAV